MGGWLLYIQEDKIGTNKIETIAVYTLVIALAVFGLVVIFTACAPMPVPEPPPLLPSSTLMEAGVQRIVDGEVTCYLSQKDDISCVVK